MTEQHNKSALRDTVESLVVTVILAIFGTTFVVQAFKIPTGSMENTLLIGDHLLVNKFVFSPRSGLLAHLMPYREVRRDDIIVFKYPYDDQAQEPGEHLVKRVIGVPGDRIKLIHRQVFVNSQAVSEPFTNYADQLDLPELADDYPPPDEDAAARYMTSRWLTHYQQHVESGELVVPPDEYFVMGDHRERSWDSRFWGFVPREMIQGRPLVIYWSFETPPDEYLHTSLNARLAQTVDLVVHFVSKTRWRRTLKVVH